MGERIRVGLSNIRKKSWGHWFVAIGLTLLGTRLSSYIESSDIVMDARYQLFQRFLSTSEGDLPAKHTAIVLIEDDEYWRGDLAGRRPIKQSYLARLVRAIDAANPAVIALDFAFRSPFADGRRVHPDYASESIEFGDAIAEVVSSDRPVSVVLARTVRYAADGSLAREAATYDSGDDLIEGKNPEITTGYIQPMHDIRLLPMRKRVDQGIGLDSFAVAAARAFRRDVVEGFEQLGGRSVPYASYISEHKFPTYRAEDVLSGTKEAREGLRNRIVLVGGRWHEMGYNRGSIVDMHTTPIGETSGVFIHANYVEAILDRRTYKAYSHKFVLIADVLLTLACSVVFAAASGVAPWAVLLVVLVGTLVLANYLALVHAGFYFDAVPPVVLVALHALIEQLREGYKDAKKFRELEKHIREDAT